MVEKLWTNIGKKRGQSKKERQRGEKKKTSAIQVRVFKLMQQDVKKKIEKKKKTKIRENVYREGNVILT